MFWVCFFFFKHSSILDLTLHSPISFSNNHSNSEGKHYFQGLYSPTSSPTAFKIRCYYDFPPGKHLRIFFASNHNCNISPCSSSPPWAGGQERRSTASYPRISSAMIISYLLQETQTEAEKDVSRSAELFFLPCTPKDPSAVQRERHVVPRLVLTQHHFSENPILLHRTLIVVFFTISGSRDKGLPSA